MAYKTAKKIGSKVYVFEESGALVSSAGWKKFTYDDGSSSWFYTKSDGTAITGWLLQGKTWYYFNEMNGRMADDLTIIDGKINLFASSGAWKGYAKGWVKDSHGAWYYSFDDTGTPAIGFETIGGRLFYFYSYNYALMEGHDLPQYNNETDDYYYVFSDGHIGVGWIEHTTTYGSSSYTDYYYADENGVLQDGWTTIGENQYYFAPNAFYMYYGGPYWVEEDSRYYLFDENGVCQGEWNGEF